MSGIKGDVIFMKASRQVVSSNVEKSNTDLIPTDECLLQRLRRGFPV